MSENQQLLLEEVGLEMADRTLDAMIANTGTYCWTFSFAAIYGYRMAQTLMGQLKSFQNKSELLTPQLVKSLIKLYSLKLHYTWLIQDAPNIGDDHLRNLWYPRWERNQIASNYYSGNPAEVPLGRYLGYMGTTSGTLMSGNLPGGPLNRLARKKNGVENYIFHCNRQSFLTYMDFEILYKSYLYDIQNKTSVETHLIHAMALSILKDDTRFDWVSIEDSHPQNFPIEPLHLENWAEFPGITTDELALYSKVELESRKGINNDIQSYDYALMLEELGLQLDFDIDEAIRFENYSFYWGMSPNYPLFPFRID